MVEALRLVTAESPRRPVLPEFDVDEVNARLEGADAETILAWAHETFGDALLMSSSFGAQSALMLHLVTRVIPKIPVVFLDTGYLFPETYQFAEELAKRFQLNLQVYGPAMTPARQEALYGRLWDGSDEDVARYHQINKIEPMDRALEELGAKGWIAGLRRSQTEFRSSLKVVELQDGIYKVHPILTWSKDDVKNYIHDHDLPYHPLYHFGYRSIGDTHSTVPISGDQDERDGRFLGAQRECGIHLPRTAEANASLKSSGL